MRTLGFLLRKEFRQILRDRTMLRMLIVLPVVQLVILANAATFEVREGKIWVVDLDRSSVSQGLIQRVVASGRFEVAGRSFSMAEADEVLLGRKASVLLQIPRGFARDIGRDGRAPLQLVFDAEDGAAAGVLQSYLSQIVDRYARDLSTGLVPGAVAATRASPAIRGGVNIRARGWYNPQLEYDNYMVPGILVVLVTIIAMSIASMNIVREKEIGTLEQLNVTPVTRSQFIASKLLPFWAIALLDLGLGLLVGWLVFDIPIEGSLTLVFASAAVYLVVALGIGLWISTVVETQQQAIFVAFSINMVYLLMSGLFTPVNSMPRWAQVAAEFSPVKHFIEIMRTVLVRGGGLDAVGRPLLILVVYGAVVFTFAVGQHRKTTS